MIRAGIAGGDAPMAGELIRLLVNHPDVDIVFVQATGGKGLPVSSLHHGLIGETDLRATDILDPGGIDVLFVASPEIFTSPFHEMFLRLPEGLRVIDMTGSSPSGLPEAVAGVPEAFRKPLVRGARTARLVHPLASAGMVALYPLAANLLLQDVRMDVQLPADLTEGGQTGKAVGELSTMLMGVQRSFRGKISVESVTPSRGRGMTVSATLPCSLPVPDVMALYEGIYDDHNFTFITRMQPHIADVEGTNRTLISVERHEPGEITVRIVADARMRGGAGEALHVMNLLFGLHEKTGLALKTSMYEKTE